MKFLLSRLTDAQLVKKFRIAYGARLFEKARCVHNVPLHPEPDDAACILLPIPLRSILF
jgi:hypothetical protein